MNKITVIVTAKDDPAGLKKTLESLCEQSTEAFDVLIVQRGQNEANLSLAREYCEEYVGFTLREADDCAEPAARNLGASVAETPMLLFMAEGDYLAPESVEAFLDAEEKTGADILLPRLYVSGENEPYYEPWSELLAVSPQIGRFDNGLLNTLDLPGRVYKKKFFDLYSLRFPETPAFSVTAFTAECVLKCDAKVSGVAGAVYDFAGGPLSRGFAPGEEPGSETLAACCRIYDDIVATVQALLEEESEGFDGDEFTFQEILFVYFSVLTNRFYRFFWFLSDDDLKTLLARFEAISARLTKERQEKIAKTFADLHFPSMYMTHADAAALPMVSFLGDFGDTSRLDGFLFSLYHGRFPFFELFLRESSRADTDPRWQAQPNLHFLPDAGFFAAARAAAAGVPVNVKDPSPLDPKVLPELSTTKAPRSVYQYLFAAKRKKYGAKTALKKKGANMK